MTWPLPFSLLREYAAIWGTGVTLAIGNRGGYRRTTARRIPVCVAAAFLLLIVAAPRAGAQLSRERAKCRKNIGKGVRKLADTVLAERATCHKLRMRGSISAGVDCNDPVSAPASVRVAAAERRLASLAVRGCQFLSPADNQYAVCPAPCDTIAISDYAGVAACLACVAEEHATQVVTAAYGTPPAPAAANSVTCQGYIGKALRKYLGARMKEQQRCQLQEDRAPTGLDCRTADVKGRVARARARVDEILARCETIAFADLDSCGADLTAEGACVKAVVELHADDLFDAVYRPFNPTPTPTATAAPSGTITLTATATAVPTPSLPATVFPTPTTMATATRSPSPGPSATSTASATATAATPQPCNPDSESYSEPAFYRSLAYRWAPLIFQDTASKWNADYIGKINYDNDWRSNNNWNNLPDAGIAPYLYYDVLETSTHWFIHYHTFHPRDWDNVFFGTCGPDPDCHENDTEDLMVMVQKDGTTYGRFRVLETEAHGNFYEYAVANDGVGNGVGADADDLDNDPERGFSLFTDTSVGVNDPRPAIYIEAKGHGICDWWDNNGPVCAHADDKVGTSGNDGVMYYPSETATPSPPPDPSGGQWYNFKSPYNLISLWDDVWVLRSCLGNNMTFDAPFIYPGVAGNGSAYIGGAMDGDDYADDAGTAWWAQSDGDNNLAAGDWTIDPARTVLRQLTFSEAVDVSYQFNPFLGIR